MVQQFDHAAKAYVSGEGASQKWAEVDFKNKAIAPHFYVAVEQSMHRGRVGFCGINNQSNERTFMATLLPATSFAGNSVPIAHFDVDENQDTSAVFCCGANSFVADFLLRQKMYANLNYFLVVATPVIRPSIGSDAFQRLAGIAKRLFSSTPEIQLAEPALDLRERARLRAEIDAIVAGLYDLSPAEFGYILTTFPLLDRDQPPLPEDFFVRWNKQGKSKFEPRSYVTRDTALLAYFRHRAIAPPDDLAAWYRDEVQVNMLDDEACLYRMGPLRNLEARVAEYHRRGAIAYIPSKAKKWDPSGPYQPLVARTE
jgi:hypothetical protein